MHKTLHTWAKNKIIERGLSLKQNVAKFILQKLSAAARRIVRRLIKVKENGRRNSSQEIHMYIGRCESLAVKLTNILILRN
jgi:glucose-6-phosphate-specific signal transduction histidine kinase